MVSEALQIKGKMRAFNLNAPKHHTKDVQRVLLAIHHYGESSFSAKDTDGGILKLTVHVC